VNWTIVAGFIAILGFCGWIYARGKQKHDLTATARTLGLQYTNQEFPNDIPLRRASFFAENDRVEDLLQGVTQGLPVKAFTLVGFPGELAIEQAVVAIKTDARVGEPTTLLRASELQVERVGDWLFFRRSQRRLRASELKQLISDCLSYLHAAEIAH